MRPSIHDSHFTMHHKMTYVRTPILAAWAAAFAFATASHAADAPADAAFWTKPKWLSDLSLSVKESYDDNVLGVSGLGLARQNSWVNSAQVNLGFNLLPLFDGTKDIQVLTFSYNPERVTFDSVSSEDYTANRFNGAFKFKADNVTVSVTDAFLYNDGNKLAETYALNQLAGAAANQNDKYRNNYAHAPVRERLAQTQDRYTTFVQVDEGNFFIRPISQLTDYKLDTYIFNTSLAPYKGYQDYVSRYDINAGVDLGFNLAPNLAFTLGYRDGFQHQDQFSLAINSDQHFASNHYQRALLGLEGKVAKWLTVKLAAGPDFRQFNPDAPVANLNTTRFFGEGTLVATLPDNQSLNFGFKQWVFVSSTGLVPYTDTAFTAAYHINVTPQFGLDLAYKYAEANYTISNDTAGSAPGLRDDLDGGGSAGFSYGLTKQLVISASYNYEDGLNGLKTLPAKYFPNYRDFKHRVVSFGIQYKF